MSEWKEFKGTDEQIAEIQNAKNGFVLRAEEETIFSEYWHHLVASILPKSTHYLICNPHPLADMIIRQAQTGQPVWVNCFHCGMPGKFVRNHKTTTPDWNIPNAEYRLSPFED